MTQRRVHILGTPQLVGPKLARCARRAVAKICSGPATRAECRLHQHTAFLVKTIAAQEFMAALK